MQYDSLDLDERLRQTERHLIRRILMYIVIQNGLQYNTHDSGYSNKQDKYLTK